MENSSEQPSNQEITPTDFDTVINERNQQAMTEQAAVAQFGASNMEAEERARQARAAIEAATNPNITTEVPLSPKPEVIKPELPVIDSGDVPKSL